MIALAMSDTKRIRVLVIAEAANPEWVSVPLVGWSHSQAIARRVDAHLVTQVRNRDAIVRAGLVEGRDFTAIDSERFARPLWKLASCLRGGEGKGWTTLAALACISYYYFERLVWKRFGREIRDGRYDLVHRLTPLSPTSPSLLAPKCRRASVPFLLGPLNGGIAWPRQFEKERRREKEWLSYARSAYKLMPGYARTLADSAALMVASKATLEQIPRKYHGKCVYIPENGIDPTRFARRRTRRAQIPIRAVFVGRLVLYKGPDMLLEAAAPLIRQGLLTIDLIGDGPLREELAQFISDQQISSGARLRGWVDHARVPTEMIESDVLAFPSIREFGGGVALEAMTLGVVPVVVNYGGPGELVTEKTGFLVEPGSREQIIHRFRQVLESICNDPSQVDRRTEPAVDRIERLFTWDRKAAQVEKVYDWVVGRRASKPDFGLPLPDEAPPVDQLQQRDLVAVS